MIAPSLPPDEVVRVQVLRDLKVLDTPPEERFDRITRLAKRLFKVNWAVVSLVDADRTWNKSAAGWEGKQSPRNLSFCAHAILGGDIMVVPDALQDARFSDHPAVVEAPRVRFYAGMPLSGPGGVKLGTLCILDTQARQFSKEDGELLKDLAVIVQDEVNNSRLNQALSQLKNSESTLEDFMENVGDLIMISTVEGAGGRILYANRALREKLGYTPEEIGRVGVNGILDQKDGAQRDALLERLKAGESLHGIKTAFVTKDGRTFPVEATANVRFRDGRPLYARVLFRDITERLQVERMKNEAVALASHELRQPLSVIMTSLDAVKRFDGELSPGQREDFIDMARRNAERLLQMVNLYLDLAKLESGAVDLKQEAVELAPLIKGAVADAAGPAAKSGVGLETEGPEDGVRVKGDPVRLVQIVTNLLSNAVKFSPAGQAVKVSWKAQDGEAVVSVADHGPGISPEFRSRIFGKFEQDRAGETERAAKGTGLGLSIAKALVERMGGWIDFDTEVGKGTTFRFSVPLWEEGARRGSG